MLVEAQSMNICVMDEQIYTFSLATLAAIVSLHQKINQIMRIFLLSICCLLISGQVLFAQKFIQMDMFGKKKAMRFHVGDELRFKVMGDDKFYILPIVDLDETSGKITLPKGEVFLHEITEIQVVAQNHRRYNLGRNLFGFGGVMLGIGTFDALISGTVLTASGFIIGGVAMVLGAVLRWAFKKRNFKINERRQIRILNLNLEDLTIA